jgi:hypothetical protein
MKGSVNRYFVNQGTAVCKSRERDEQSVVRLLSGDYRQPSEIERDMIRLAF